MLIKCTSLLIFHIVVRWICEVSKARSTLCEIIKLLTELMLVQAFTGVKIEMLKNHDFVPW